MSDTGVIIDLAATGTDQVVAAVSTVKAAAADLGDAVKASGDSAGSAGDAFQQMGDAATSGAGAAQAAVGDLQQAADGAKQSIDDTGAAATQAGHDGQQAGHDMAAGAHEAAEAWEDVKETAEAIGVLEAVHKAIEAMDELAADSNKLQDVHARLHTVLGTIGELGAEDGLREKAEELNKLGHFGDEIQFENVAAQFALLGISAESSKEGLEAAAISARLTGGSVDGAASALERLYATGKVTPRAMKALGITLSDSEKSAIAHKQAMDQSHKGLIAYQGVVEALQKRQFDWNSSQSAGTNAAHDFATAMEELADGPLGHALADDFGLIKEAAAKTINVLNAVAHVPFVAPLVSGAALGASAFLVLKSAMTVYHKGLQLSADMSKYFAAQQGQETKQTVANTDATAADAKAKLDLAEADAKSAAAADADAVAQGNDAKAIVATGDAAEVAAGKVGLLAKAKSAMASALGALGIAGETALAGAGAAAIGGATAVGAAAGTGAGYLAYTGAQAVGAVDQDQSFGDRMSTGAHRIWAFLRTGHSSSYDAEMQEQWMRDFTAKQGFGKKGKPGEKAEGGPHAAAEKLEDAEGEEIVPGAAGATHAGGAAEGSQDNIDSLQDQLAAAVTPEEKKRIHDELRLATREKRDQTAEKRDQAKAEREQTKDARYNALGDSSQINEEASDQADQIKDALALATERRKIELNHALRSLKEQEKIGAITADQARTQEQALHDAYEARAKAQEADEAVQVAHIEAQAKIAAGEAEAAAQTGAQREATLKKAHAAAARIEAHARNQAELDRAEAADLADSAKSEKGAGGFDSIMEFIHKGGSLASLGHKHGEGIGNAPPPGASNVTANPGTAEHQANGDIRIKIPDIIVKPAEGKYERAAAHYSF